MSYRKCVNAQGKMELGVCVLRRCGGCRVAFCRLDRKLFTDGRVPGAISVDCMGGGSSCELEWVTMMEHSHIRSILGLKMVMRRPLD
ncbi:hypothetical protein EAH_00066540 [Eimeria acervulina]|uniref:Uncharacterized protein n=1 Tax=Eimeria acervulina TaxID=5801 RepID=U6GSA1_EIMAC|nr:hypothetical protein EAH_00066540 [Eimeria acervulina]CDI82462.1 hypothetical protein EAH_00066540 [Eimeria acervulina]